MNQKARYIYAFNCIRGTCKMTTALDTRRRLLQPVVNLNILQQKCGIRKKYELFHVLDTNVGKGKSDNYLSPLSVTPPCMWVVG